MKTRESVIALDFPEYTNSNIQKNCTKPLRLPPVCAGGTTEDTVDVISSFLINTEYVTAGLVFGNDLQCNLAKESGPKKKKERK